MQAIGGQSEEVRRNTGSTPEDGRPREGDQQKTGQNHVHKYIKFLCQNHVHKYIKFLYSLFPFKNQLSLCIIKISIGNSIYIDCPVVRRDLKIVLNAVSVC